MLTTWLTGLDAEFAAAIRTWVASERASTEREVFDHTGASPDRPITLAAVFQDLPARLSGGTNVAGATERILDRLRRPIDDPQDVGLAPVQLRHDGRALRVVVVGGPGQGKSTVLRYLAQVHRAHLLGDDGYGRVGEVVARLPLFVEARRLAAFLARDPSGIPAFLGQKVGVDAEHLGKWLGRTPLLVFLDGVDEVTDPRSRTRVWDALGALTARRPDVVVIVSTRPTGDGGLRDWPTVTLTPLDPAAARALASHVLRLYWQDRPQRRAELQTKLQDATRTGAVRALLTTPLQVAMVVVLLGRSGGLPSERWRLVDRYYEAIHDREVEKSGPLSPLLAEHRALLRRLHRLIALLLHARGEVAGREEARLGRLELGALLRTLLAADGHGLVTTHRRAAALVRAVTDRLVLLVARDDEGALAFEVRLLQEAFAAEGLVQGPDDQVVARLEQVGHAEAWREVWVLAVERLAEGRPHLVDAAIGLLEGLDADEVGQVTRPGGRLAAQLLHGPLARTPKWRRRLEGLVVGAFCVPADLKLPRSLVDRAVEAVKTRPWREVPGAWESLTHFEVDVESALPEPWQEREALNGIADWVVSTYPDRFLRVKPMARPRIILESGGDRVASVDVALPLECSDTGEDFDRLLARFLESLDVRMLDPLLELADRAGRTDWLRWHGGWPVAGYMESSGGDRARIVAGDWGGPRDWRALESACEDLRMPVCQLADWRDSTLGAELLLRGGLWSFTVGQRESGRVAEYGLRFGFPQLVFPSLFDSTCSGTALGAAITAAPHVPSWYLILPACHRDDACLRALEEKAREHRLRDWSVWSRPDGLSLPPKAFRAGLPFDVAEALVAYGVDVASRELADDDHPVFRAVAADASSDAVLRGIEASLAAERFTLAYALARLLEQRARVCRAAPLESGLTGRLVREADRRPTGLHQTFTWTALGLPTLPTTNRSTTLEAPLGTPVPPQLRRIELRDLAGFARLDLDLPAPDAPDRGQWLVLIGENGTGKTTLLRGLALAAGGLVRAASAVSRLPQSPVRLGADRATVTVHLEEGTRWTLDLPREGDPSIQGPPAQFLAAYGVGRGQALSATAVPEFTPWTDVATLFGDTERGLIHAATWLKDFRDPTGWRAAAWPALHRALCRILPGVEQVELTVDGVFLHGPELGRMPLAAMSDGYLTTAGWVLDLIARWTHHAARLDMDIDDGFLDRMTGLVLIDEIDLHLHPEWQRHVIDDVRALFPRLSFVVTTHQPLTLHGTRDGEVMQLRREGGATAARPVRLRPGMDADAILLALFELDTTLDADTARLAREHQADLLRGRRDEARARTLVERLGGGVPALDPTGRAALRARLARLREVEE